MVSGPEFSYSHTFDGIIWNTLVSPAMGLMVLEVRNAERRAVSFAALHYERGEFVWRDVTFDEPWWISLSAIAGESALFTIYTETNNPDQKSLLAFGLKDKMIKWWQNDFSLTAASDTHVTGYSHKFGLKELNLDVFSGKVLPEVTTVHAPQNLNVIRPFHYKEGDAGFETIRTYMTRVVGGMPVIGLDYLEHYGLIFVSCYIHNPGLANYLIVLTGDGEVVLNEKPGENLKGIGIDTFFLLEGSLFFVKNTCELVCYKLL